MRRIPFLLIAVIVIVALCAVPFIAHAANPPARIRVTELPDGTYLVSDNDLGYQLTTPASWYPIAIPASHDETDKFNALSQEHHLPFDKGWIPSLPADVLRFAIVDLEAKNYGVNGGAFIAAPSAYVTNLVPNGALVAVLNLIKTGNTETVTSIKEIAGQKVGIVEFTTPPGNQYFFGGKMLVFIRKGMVISIVGISSERELVPTALAIFDRIMASLTFFDAE